MIGSRARQRLLVWIAGVLLGTGVALPDSPDTTALDNLRALIKNAHYAEAESGARKLLAKVEVRGGADSVEAAEAIDLLIEVRWRAGRGLDTEAMMMIDRAVGIKMKVLGAEGAGVAVSLNMKGILLREAGDLAAARGVFDRALRIREKALPPDHPDIAASQSSLGNVLLELGEFADARRLYESALHIEEKVFGSGDIRVARTINRLAILFRTMGDYAASRPLYERALDLTKRARGPDHPDVAGILNGLAILLERTGDFAGARRQYESALEITKKANGPDHLQVALVLNNLGSALVYMGDYVEARRMLDRALEIRRGALGAEHPHVATTLWNLGRLSLLTGDFTAAKSFYSETLGIWRNRLGAEAVEVATCLHDLAAVSEAQGNLEEARDLYEKALAIRRRALPAEHEDVALSLNSLARIRSALGDGAGARDLYRQALTIRQKLFGQNHQDVAESHHDLASTLDSAGDDLQARDHYQQALQIRETVLGQGHPSVAETLVGLGGILSRSGELQAALDAALRAEAISRSHLRLTARSLPERQALAYAAARASGLDLALWLAGNSTQHAPGMAMRVWDALVRSRALVLDEMGSRHRALMESDDPDVTRLVTTLHAARTRLANLTVRGPDPGHPAGYRQLIEETREQVEEVERSLAGTSLSFRQEIAASQTGLAEAISAMPPSSALVAFALHHSRHRPAGARLPAPSYIAFVIRNARTQAAFVSIGEAEEIDALVERWRDRTRPWAMRSNETPGQLEAEYRLAGGALRERIWDPISRLVSGSELVLIVPDGALNLVNFASLPVGHSNYLVERGPSIHYLSAERDLVSYGTPGPGGRGLLVMGPPDFEKTAPLSAPVSAAKGSAVSGAIRSTDCVDFQKTRFEPLPASVREAEEVIEQWTRSRRVGVAGRPGGSAHLAAEVVHLKGAEATEAAFKQAAPGRKILHLATHGFFLAGRCLSAFDSFRGIGGLSPGHKPFQALPAGENPLILSGLVLAGANRREATQPESEDGVLTGEEIASLDLSAAEWAVLSACDTGVGTVRVGEGVFGLRRAFQVAGARTLIMSLWPVEDESAREWMRALYAKRFLEGRETADAVKQASRELLQRRRERGDSTHPFFWAGFVAAGDWR